MRDAFAVSAVSGIFQSKAVWQFAQMIECVQPDVNALAYNEYGCWCGLGGKGTPVDGVDRYAHGCRTGERLQRESLLRCVCVVLQVLSNPRQLLRGEQEGSWVHGRGRPSLRHRVQVQLLKATGHLLR